MRPSVSSTPPAVSQHQEVPDGHSLTPYDEAFNAKAEVRQDYFFLRAFFAFLAFLFFAILLPS